MQKRLEFTLFRLLSIALLFFFREGQTAALVNFSPNCEPQKCIFFSLVFAPVHIVVVNTVDRVINQYGVINTDGEVKSVSELPIANIALRTKFYVDGSYTGELHDSPESSFLISATLPSQPNLFILHSTSTVFPGHTITHTIEVLAATIDTTLPYRNLTVERVATAPLPFGQPVTVTIRNDYLQSIRNILIHIWHLEESRDNYCTTANCYRRISLAILLPGQVYTATTTLNFDPNYSYGHAIPASAINVVAQGTISP